MSSSQALEALFTGQGYNEFRWIDPRRIVVAEWVRLKCTFGCEKFGRNATCPPNVPPVPACRRLLDEYTRAAVFRFVKPDGATEDRRTWTRGVNAGLVALERAVFLAGFPRAFLFAIGYCNQCAECVGPREACRNPRSARPTPEGMGIDVFTTVRELGYPIEVLSERDQTMNRYAFLLVE